MANHVGVRANMHEIGVAVPSWNKVNVHMVWKAGTGASFKVYTYVKAVRRYCFGKSRFAIAGKLDKFKKFFIGSIVKVRNVSCRCYEQVPVVIREPVKNYDGISCSPKDEVFLVIIFVI